MNPTFSHIAIGTEITIGQILNKNSHWLSQELTQLGFTPIYHVSVSDDPLKIKEAFQFISKHSDFIFVTGGLGPTADDLTREVVAEVTQNQLEWNEGAWDHLVSYLQNRNLKARENHKKEALLPKKAHLLINPEGTACGFIVKHQNQKWIVLPGPPNEIKAIWDNNLKAILVQSETRLNPLHMHKWDTFGLPESALAELLTPHLNGCPLEIAYRIHLPYVEFKFIFSESEKLKAQVWIEKVDSLLMPYLVCPPPLTLFESIRHYLGSLYNNTSLLIFNPGRNKPLKQKIESLPIPNNNIYLNEWGNYELTESLSFKGHKLLFKWLNNNLSLELTWWSTDNTKKKFLVTNEISNRHTQDRIDKFLIEKILIEFYHYLLTIKKIS